MDNPEKLATLDTQDTRGRQKKTPKNPQHNANPCYFQFCIKHLTRCLNYMNIFNV